MVEYKETMSDEDLETRVLEAVSEGRPYVMVIVTDIDDDGSMDLRAVTGGGISDAATVKALLSKALRAFP